MDPNPKRKAPETPSEDHSDHIPPCLACQDRGLMCADGCVFAAAYPPDLLHYFPSLKKFHGLDEVEQLLSAIPESHNRQSFLRSLIIDAVGRESFPRIGFVDTINTLSREIKILQVQTQQLQQTLSSNASRLNVRDTRLQNIVDTLERIQEYVRSKQI